MNETDSTNAYRVLIVDDEETTNEHYAALLEAHGYNVRTALDSASALDINATFHAQLALVDLVMDHENGIDVLDNLLQQDPDILCLMLTAHADVDSALQALRHGAVDYLSKLISPQELLQALHRASEKLRLIEDKKRYEAEIEQQNKELTKSNQRLELEIRERTKAEASVLKMMDEVEAARKKLKSANIILETRIQERTHELQKSREQLETIIESTADGILVVDENGNILHTNGRFIDIWNLPESVFSKGDVDIVYKHIAEQLAKPVGFISTVKSLYESDDATRALLETRDGRIIERSYHPLSGESELKGQVWSFRDITDKVKAETQLAESEHKYRGILETSSEGCWIIDPVTKQTLEINQSLCSLIGYEREEIIGKTPLEFVDDENRKIFKEQTSKILTTDHRIYDIKLRHKSGRNIPCIFNASTIYSDGEARYAVAFVTDITNHVELEHTLLNAMEDAERANSAKSEFLSRMSHELRTPLNAIIGFGQILSMDNASFTESQKKSIEHIYKSGKHLLLLINEILDITKVDAGKMSVSLEPVSMAHQLDETITMVRSMAEGSHIQIIEPVERSEHYVIADKLRLKQVLLNLLSNAIKYNRAGGKLVIEQTMLPHTPDNHHHDMLRVLITDDGPGIKPEDYDKVFLPFSRINNEDNVEGTGVGLTITKKLIELMHGDIGFNSKVGKGSTFWIDLPCADKDMPYPSRTTSHMTH